MPREALERIHRDLLDESQEIHRDAMQSTKVELRDLEDRHQDVFNVKIDEEESQFRGRQLQDEARDEAKAHEDLVSGFGLKGVAISGALTAGLLALNSTSAFAGTASDIQILQTQASIENLAVATYSVALTLPFIGGSSAIPLVKQFVIQTKAQHAEHAQTFNAALRRLHAKIQTKPDPVLLKVVNSAKPHLTTPLAVVALALELENGAAATYVKNAATMTDQQSRVLTASIMGVEAQHVAILLAVQALIKAGDASMIKLPPPLGSLPSAAGSVGFPAPFFSTTQARPNNEGAVH